METSLNPQGDKITAGTHVPYWVATSYVLSYQKLAVNKEADVVIVGGGIAGVSIAYCLCREGKKVILVEDGYVASGETGRTTAHLVTALDDRYYELERIFGEENTKLIANSHASAIDFIERTVASEKIACDFERVTGFLFRHPTDDPDNLSKEYEACKRAGLDVEQSTIVLGNKTVEKVIKFNGQAQFHPVKYLKALCEAIQRMGGDIYTGTHAKEIDQHGIVTDDGFKIKAEHVVVATNTPVNNKYLLHLKQFAYRTYVIGMKAKKGTHPVALWWDTGDMSANKKIPPYHYVRTQKFNATHDLLIVGGEDHAVGLADAEKKPEEERYSSLEKWARRHFEGVEDVVYKWSGQVMEPSDSLAYIGHNPFDKNNVYVVSGDSGNGMTHGTIAGMLIRDLIIGRENRWAKIYSPSRFKLFKSGSVFFKEFVGGLMSYLKTKPGQDSTALGKIARNEGAVITFEGKKFGAYRDENNLLHFVDAECSHLGCIIKWNNDEKSWDCPCHGSRFSFNGKVLHGPANEPLVYYAQHEKHLNNI
jgi:glycine/D-amino acid oxidase-like deaminating enzyme/nitrite reductase/ring-hydroxylating ferredoxin subunit